MARVLLSDERAVSRTFRSGASKRRFRPRGLHVHCLAVAFADKHLILDPNASIAAFMHDAVTKQYLTPTEPPQASTQPNSTSQYYSTKQQGSLQPNLLPSGKHNPQMLLVACVNRTTQSVMIQPVDAAATSTHSHPHTQTRAHHVHARRPRTTGRRPHMQGVHRQSCRRVTQYACNAPCRDIIV